MTATDAGRSDAHVATSITWRVFAGTAIIVGLVVLAALLMASSAARRSSEATARRSLDQAADLVAQLLAGRERSLAGGARVFVQGPYFRTLVAERRRDDILDQSFEAAEQLQASWVFITDAAGTLLAKSDEPSAAGDALGSVALVANALRGQIAGGFGVSGDSLLFQITAVPIALPNARPLGALMAARTIDSALAVDIRSATASEVVFYAIDRAGTPHVVASTLPLTPALHTSIGQLVEPSAGGTIPWTSRSGGRDVDIDGVIRNAQLAALTTAGGDVIGGYAVLRTQDDALATLTGVRRSLGTAGVLGFLLALMAAWIAARSVTRPVRTLAEAVQRAVEGDYESPTTVPESNGDSKGEIGTLTRAFDALLLDLRDKDLLSATTAAAVAVDEARQGDESVRRGRRDGTLTFGTPSTAIGAPDRLPRGHLLANRYDIDTLLGRGGTGVVYRARDRVLGEVIAIKLLRPEVLGTGDEARAALQNELRLTRLVTHRNVVRTHDIGESDSVPFLTMEYVDGASLHTVIRVRGKLPVPAVLSLARQLMRALAAAHDVGVVHGDIKPSNILIGPNGVLKVTDFGVARMLRAAQRPSTAAQTANSGVTGHLAGAIVGTPEYLAPELLIGGAPTGASDLYAAGIVLHECLVGTTPYRSDTPMAFLASKLETSGVSSSSSVAARAAHERASIGIPALLESLLGQLTHPEPGNRPASPSAVRDLLSRIR